MRNSKKAQTIVENAMDATDCFQDIEEDGLTLERVDEIQDKAIEVLKARMKDPIGLKAIVEFERAEVHDDRLRRRIIKVSVRGRGKTVVIAQLAEKIIGLFRHQNQIDEPPEAA